MHPKATKTRNRQIECVQESEDDRLYGPNYARDASIHGQQLSFRYGLSESGVGAYTSLMSSSLLSGAQYI